MIKVKITGKVGTSLQRELPTDIHQLYHDMREASISKPLKNILGGFENSPLEESAETEEMDGGMSMK